MDVDKEIEKLMNQRRWLKIQINSTYGSVRTSDMFERRDNITMKLKRLHRIKSRKLKLDKIINRNETSMEV